MTETKRRLNDLDRLEAPDVWDRALRMEPMSDLEEAPRSVRTRMTVIVVAFAVFIAAAAFAWQALRPPSGSGPAGATASSGSILLWPERAEAAAQATQFAVDSGDASSSWRTDPSAVASRFAEDVLRWGKPEGTYQVTVGERLPTGSVEVNVTRFALPCPSPLPGSGPGSCPPPFEDETLTLSQPGRTGAGGIWSVTEVRAAGLDMTLAVGAQVPNGANIPGAVTVPDTAPSVPGFSVVSGETIGSRPGCGETGGGQIHEGAGTVASVEIRPPDMVDCGSSTDGYVWIATEAAPLSQGAVVADPLEQTPSYLTFFGLTMVPVRVLF